MLALNSTIGCIEADESEVLALYRSPSIVMTPVTGSRPASMEAYICAIQGKSQTKVHLALVADNRRIYVYLESLKATDAAGIERSLQQAIGCARSMGFAPEAVDLNYRPAMREVVLRNIKILRSPGSKAIALLKHGLPGAPVLPPQVPAGKQHDKKPVDAAGKAAGPATAPAPATSTPPPASVVPAAKGASLPTATTATTIPAAPAPPASPALSRGERSSVSVLQLEKELQLMATERDALLAQLQQLSQVHQEIVMELSVQKEEATRVTTEMDRLARSDTELKATVTERDSLKREVRDLAAKLQESQRIAEERLEVNRNLSAELAGAQKEAKALVAQRDTLQKKAETAALQAEKVVEESRALSEELDELRSVSEAELVRMSSLEQDLFTLAAELGTATTEAATARAELSAALTGVATAEAELVVARSKVVAAEAKIAGMSRNLKATELELDRTRAELAATLTDPPANLQPAPAQGAQGSAPTASVTVAAATKAADGTTTTGQATAKWELPPSPTPKATSGSAPPPAKVVNSPGKDAKPAIEPKEEELESKKNPPSGFGVPAPRAAEHTAAPKQSELPKQAGIPKGGSALSQGTLPEQAVAEQTPVSKAEPEQTGIPKQEPVQDKRTESTRSKAEEEPRQPVANLQQAPPASSGEENAIKWDPLAPGDLEPVEGIEASSWYGVDELNFLPDFTDSLTPDSRVQDAPCETTPTPPQPQTHDFPPFGELQESFFSVSDDPAPVGQFVLRPDLKVIEYLKPEDVVELHQSINHANMSIDGKGQESCRGYICSLKCGERLQVFAAIYGTRSGRTSVYAPEAQPGDEASYEMAIRSAINFAEEVGLMMEPVKGGATALQAESVVQCPVLKKAA